MGTLTFSYPDSILPFPISSGVTTSSFSNSIRIFVISFSIFLVQKSVSDCLLTSYASFTFLETRKPNLFDVRQYLDFTLEIILSLCLKVSLTHQLKEGSSLISFSTVYSARSTGLDCLGPFSGTQSTDPSFHFH